MSPLRRCLACKKPHSDGDFLQCLQCQSKPRGGSKRREGGKGTAAPERVKRDAGAARPAASPSASNSASSGGVVEGEGVVAVDPRFDSSWEREYYQRLEALKAAGEIRDFRWKDFRVRIAATEPGQRDSFYTPECLVWMNDGTICVDEVKGRKRDAGMLRFKVAASTFPCFTWRMWSKIDGEWRTVRQVGEQAA